MMTGSLDRMRLQTLYLQCRFVFWWITRVTVWPAFSVYFHGLFHCMFLGSRNKDIFIIHHILLSHSDWTNMRINHFLFLILPYIVFKTCFLGIACTPAHYLPQNHTSFTVGFLYFVLRCVCLCLCVCVLILLRFCVLIIFVMNAVVCAWSFVLSVVCGFFFCSPLSSSYLGRVRRYRAVMNDALPVSRARVVCLPVLPFLVSSAAHLEDIHAGLAFLSGITKTTGVHQSSPTHPFHATTI